MSRLTTMAALLFALAAALSFALPSGTQAQGIDTCFDEPITIVADGAAEVVGTPGRDVIDALDGVAQSIDGLGGDDLICAGAGDTVIAGSGHDSVNAANFDGDSAAVSPLVDGGSGNDLLIVTNADVVDGGSGHDELIVSRANVVRGGSGNDVVAAFVQPIGTCDGGSGIDVLGFESGAGCEVVISVEKAFAD